MRFLEWVSDNPEGVISLPTGKTPEYFIEWVRRALERWDSAEGRLMREESGLTVDRRPDLSGLRFVQIDEFYPIDPRQHNSFYNYVQKYYVGGFGLDPKRGQLSTAMRFLFREAGDSLRCSPTELSISVSATVSRKAGQKSFSNSRYS